MQNDSFLQKRVQLVITWGGEPCPGRNLEGLFHRKRSVDHKEQVRIQINLQTRGSGQHTNINRKSWDTTIHNPQHGGQKLSKNLKWKGKEPDINTRKRGNTITSKATPVKTVKEQTGKRKPTLHLVNSLPIDRTVRACKKLKLSPEGMKGN